MSSSSWQLYTTISDVASVTLFNMKLIEWCTYLTWHFFCNLLEQNGYLLSEIYDLSVNTFIFMILIPIDCVFVQTE